MWGNGQPRGWRAPQLCNLGALICEDSVERFNLGFQPALVLPALAFGATSFRFFCFSKKFVRAPLGHWDR